LTGVGDRRHLLSSSIKVRGAGRETGLGRDVGDGGPLQAIAAEAAHGGLDDLSAQEFLARVGEIS